jgi:hypothetical protein
VQPEPIGEILDIEVIAVGPAIRELARLRRVYGAGWWRKLKGTRSGAVPGRQHLPG